MLPSLYRPFASDYWTALDPRRRLALISVAALILAGALAAGVWLLRDPVVPLEHDLSPPRMAALTAELDRAKLPYRVGDDGVSVEVARSLWGQARALAGGSGLNAPGSVGLELFKDADFSATDFAQRVNYQRALQGELTRTIQTLAGVRSARVHVILPEAGLLRRTTTKATAAVGLTMNAGQALSRVQVAGIQRLVAASVPDIRLEDIVVFDDSGASLTRTTSAVEAEPSSAQLELKREVDAYLEGKLRRLLDELAPAASVSLSVDVSLDYKQSRVTTEEPLSVPGPKDAEHATGVVVRERQSQKSPAGMMQTGGDAAGPEASDWEYEYQVGHRVEQTLLAPGSIRRISVAVAMHGAPSDLGAAALEQFVSHGVGLDRARGDSVTVLLLPGASVEATSALRLQGTGSEKAVSALPAGQGATATASALPAGWWGLAAAGVLVVGWRLGQRRRAMQPATHTDLDAVEAQVRRWLSEGSTDGRR